MNSRIVPFLALLVAAGIFFGYVSPAWSGSIAEKKAAIASSEKTLLAAASFLAHQDELMKARDAMDPTNLERLAKLLPDSVNNVGLILDLNALAARSGLVVSNIDVSTPTPVSATADGFGPAEYVSPEQSVTISLSAVGPYSALKTFLAGVEKSGRLLDVQDLAIQGSETGVYTYRMKIRIYWLR